MNKWARERDGFQMIAGCEEGICVAVMGMRILFDLTHGKHLYIDDLVVDETKRSRGIGDEMIRYAEKYAHENDCRSLRLCSGVDNRAAHKFYERHGFQAKSFAFKKFL